MTTQSKPIEILIVDDCEIMASSIQDLLQDETDMRIVAVSPGIEDAFRFVQDHGPDVALIDLSFKTGGSGLDLVKRIRRGQLPTRCLIVSAHAEADLSEACRSAQAHGFVNKMDLPEKLCSAVRDVYNGKEVYSRT